MRCPVYFKCADSLGSLILSKIWVNIRTNCYCKTKTMIICMILNNFLRPLHIFPTLFGHQETLHKHLHHSLSQFITSQGINTFESFIVIEDSCQNWRDFWTQILKTLSWAWFSVHYCLTLFSMAIVMNSFVKN